MHIVRTGLRLVFPLSCPCYVSALPSFVFRYRKGLLLMMFVYIHTRPDLRSSYALRRYIIQQLTASLNDANLKLNMSSCWPI